MAEKSNPWKPLAILSAIVVIGCMCAGYFDAVTQSRFQIIGSYNDMILIVWLVASFSLSITLILWARHLGKSARLFMALTVLLAPWVVVLFGYLVVGTMSHDPSGIVMLTPLPASVLATILVVMSIAAKGNP